MSEDIIEDITEEALLEDQELVQDTSAEEVTEQQGYSETIEGILLGEGKKSKTESDEEESEEDESEEEEEMEESVVNEDLSILIQSEANLTKKVSITETYE